MKIGFNMLLLTTHVTEEHFPLFQVLKKLGYDGVEIPVLEGEVAHYKNIAKALNNNGLAVTTATIIQAEDHNPISANPEHRKNSVGYLKWAVDCTGALGAGIMCGPFHQPVGQFSGKGPTEDEKKWGADVHRKVAEHAGEKDIMLALEFLNRFEAYFLNTMDDLVAYVKRVDHPNFRAMYDTFHANIEEKDPIGCIVRHGDYIKHVHICENDRGIPGRGHINWAGIFKALHSIGYDNWLTTEVFGSVLPKFAAAAKVWRDFFTSTEEVYTESIKFVKQQWTQVN